ALERAEFDAAGSGETIRLDLNPIQMSLAVADLAKLRFIKQDPHTVFSKLLRSISDVSPSLGGLAVCHVVCALARASDARTLSWRSKKVLTVHTNEDSFQMLLLNKLEAQLLNRMDELQPQGLSASAAAFVKLRRCSQELFAGLARVSMRCLASFSPEDFAMMSSALGAVPDAFSSSWSCSLLEQLGEHAARSLTQSSWSPRQVAQVFRPFASQALPEGLLTAAVGHFRTEAKNYSPRDVAKFLSGIGSATRNKDFAAVLWGALKPRLAARNPASGAETLAMAQALAQLRHVIPASQLRHRFRFLSRSLRRAVDCQLLQPHEQATALQIWALLGLRDWPLLAKLAGRGLEALAANTVLRLTDGADTILPAHPEDLSEAIYAFAKLGAPDLVPGACRPPVSGFLLRAMKVLDAADAVVRLSERGLQQLLLGIALSGPSEEAPLARFPAQAFAERPRSMVPVSQRSKSLRGVSVEIRFANLRLDAASETARLVTNCAALEFWLTSDELSPEPAEFFSDCLKINEAEPKASLRTLELNVLTALERFLKTNPSEEDVPPSISIMHQTPVGDIKLAIPSWNVAIMVGLPPDFFQRPPADSGWGSTGENELDHGALPGDFVHSLGETVELEAPCDERTPMPNSSQHGGPDNCLLDWQRLPALRIRLLKQLGWRVVQIPYFEWRKLLRSEELSFLRQLLRRSTNGWGGT
ncbi:unnamed protein product, partial [Durusdinium trenchii]